MYRIRAITLDLDDTLWEIGPVIGRAEAELWQWLAEYYPRIPQQVSVEQALQIREEISAEHPDKQHDFRFLRKQTLARIAKNCGYEDDLIEPAFSVFDAARNKVELFPDVLPVLDVLSSSFRVIAVTNGNANLETIGIRHLFHDVVTAVDAGAAKPAESIFAEAVRRSGVECGQVLHVGDHPENDVDGARRAGLRSVWMNRNGSEWPNQFGEPELVVRTMTELHDLLLPAWKNN